MPWPSATSSKEPAWKAKIKEVDESFFIETENNSVLGMLRLQGRKPLGKGESKGQGGKRPGIAVSQFLSSAGLAGECQAGLAVQGAGQELQGVGAPARGAGPLHGGPLCTGLKATSHPPQTEQPLEAREGQAPTDESQAQDLP